MYHCTFLLVNVNVNAFISLSFFLMDVTIFVHVKKSKTVYMHRFSVFLFGNWQARESHSLVQGPGLSILNQGSGFEP